VVLAAVGTTVLISHRPEQAGAYRTARVVRRALGLTGLLLLASLPAIVFPQHPPLATTGRFQVATASYTYTDPTRAETYTTTGQKRKVNVKLWYPANGTGRYPLLVFSHGAFGVKSSNTSLFEELASHGYVVSSIDHPFHSLYTKDDRGHTTLINRGYVKDVSEPAPHSPDWQPTKID
jgi:hypothetical protein